MLQTKENGDERFNGKAKEPIIPERSTDVGPTQAKL